MRTRHIGTIQSFNDEKGFGWIVPRGGGARIFFHITALTDPSHRPTGGEVVSYEPSKDDKGRPRAQRVQYVGMKPINRPESDTLTAPTIAALLFFGSVWFAFKARNELPGLLALIVATSVLSFLMYGLDKSRAEDNAWRISEKSLHLLALFGGWPGAMLAQQYFRHKVKKSSFMAVFWITVALNSIGMVALWWSPGSLK